MLNKAGWELHRYRPASDPWALVLDLLKRHEVNLVIDVGANVGQYASELRNFGYTGRIVSFEPLVAAHALLQRNAARDDAWIVAPRCAIGARSGEVTINVSENSVSSSVLPISETHVHSAPDSKYVKSEQTPLKMLDDATEAFLTPNDRVFIKIDTQGFESEVLDGANVILQRAFGLCVETSLVPLYIGQHLWLKIVERLEAAGWVLWDIRQAFSDPTTGQILQADLVFSRRIAER